MASTATETEPLISFVLPGIPESAGVARCHVRAALAYHGLEDYWGDAAVIASELVSNAVQHAGMDSTEVITVTLMRVRKPDAMAIVVGDSSPHPPILRETTADSERGRGLQVVDALSVHWGWNPDDGGKEVFAVLARED
jgi:anti-sigma regulatory factor (Ser/Thr protein kinase)